MKKFLSAILIAILLLSALPFGAGAREQTVYNPFADVLAKDYYYEAVLWAVDEGITLGTEPTRFSPALACTRAQAVTFLWRAAGSPLPANSRNPFGDVVPDAYYHTAVLWAVEQGLTTGTAAGVFSPDLQCTRAQIATFLYRFADAPAKGQANPFTDVAAGAYYYDAVLWAVKEGITLGMGDGKFSPDAPCVRAQIVTFLHRSKDLFAPKEEEIIIPEGAWWLCNEYDGYNMMVGPEFTEDSSRAEVATVLKSADTVIEIYRQELERWMTAESYIAESNAFLKNKTDHILTLEETKVYSGRKVHTTAWHREKLAQVEEDKNYYISFEIPEGRSVLSIFVKTAREDAAPEDYKLLLRTLEFCAPSGQAPLFTGAPAEKQWNQETQAFYDTYFDPDATLSWGIMEPSAAGPADFSVVDAYEDALNYDFSVLSTYSSFSKDSLEKLATRLNNTWADGKVLQLSIQPDPSPDRSVMYEILQGKWDEAIGVYVETVKEFGHPVLIRLMNEMNGLWVTYSSVHTSKDTQIYIETYRYIVDKFNEAGVENVIWVWNPNEVSYPTFDWNDTLMYYPGDEYVDIVGLTAFNTGTYFASVGERWRTFDELYTDLYAEYTARFSHPLMITGFACAEMGGDKRAWTEDMFQKIGTYDRIKIAIWFDSVDRDWENGGIISRDFRIRGENVDIFDLFMKYIGTPDSEAPEEGGEGSGTPAPAPGEEPTDPPPADPEDSATGA